jgi:hypothetical protein
MARADFLVKFDAADLRRELDKIVAEVERKRKAEERPTHWIACPHCRQRLTIVPVET